MTRKRSSRYSKAKTKLATRECESLPALLNPQTIAVSHKPAQAQATRAQARLIDALAYPLQPVPIVSTAGAAIEHPTGHLINQELAVIAQAQPTAITTHLAQVIAAQDQVTDHLATLTVSVTLTGALYRMVATPEGVLVCPVAV